MSTTTLDSLDRTIIVRHDEAFAEACRELRRNRGTATGFKASFFYQCPPVCVAQFANSVAANSTVHELTLCLSPAAFSTLGANEMRVLGTMVANSELLYYLTIKDGCSNNAFSSRLWDGVAQNPSVARLTVIGVNVEEGDIQPGLPLEDILRHLSSTIRMLQDFRLKGYSIDDGSAEALAHVLETNTPRVDSLEFRECELSTIGQTRIFESLARNTYLTCLDFHGMQIADECAEAIETALTVHIQLWQFRIFTTTLGDPVIEAVRSGMKKNFRVLTGVPSNGTQFQNEAESEIDYNSLLNNCGRDDLHDPDVSHALKCKQWFRVVTDYSENHQVVFTFLTSYPDVLGTFIGQAIDPSLTIESTAHVGAKRHISQCS